MKVFEIQHSDKTQSLVTIANIEGVSLVTETENVEYAGDLYEKSVKTFYINMKSSKQYTIQSTDKIYSLSDSHRNGKWEIVRDEISFDDFYTAIAIELIQKN